MLEKILKELIERRAAMALECFDSPPADWAAFQNRAGRYYELADLIDIVAKIMAGNETDEV